MNEPRRIVITEGQGFNFDGKWTVGEILAAAEQLAQYIQSQQISFEQPETQDQISNES